MFVGVWLLSAALVWRGIVLWRMANRAQQGAVGEQQVAESLQPLEQEGWSLGYGVSLGRGDVDIVCQSPRGQWFAIEVKSHGGTLVEKKGRLFRRYGSTTYGFEKDFLRQSMSHALAFGKQQDIKFVTPVLVFSRADVDSQLEGIKMKGVYLSSRQHLPRLLRQLMASDWH